MLILPPIEESRYYTVQLMDFYTHNYAYLGARTTGHEGGSFLIAGPGWDGEKPEGITKVIRTETTLGRATYRTQLFNPDDIDNVKKIQKGYIVQPLSEFLRQPPPASAPPIEWIMPVITKEQKSSLEMFHVLSFCLQFCPVQPSEVELRGRFAKLGLEGGNFDPSKLSPEIRKAIMDGIADAWEEFALVEEQVARGEVTSGDVFGTREHLKNNYLYRMVGAVLGIYGNSREEAIYPMLQIDVDGNRLDASKKRYTLRFEKGQLPPVRAFWSVTMYDLPDRMLVSNPLERYLINSPMLPDLRRDSDGGITIYIQHESPGKDRESNWLPAPNGPFFMAMRLYMPLPEAFDGSWQVPKIQVAGTR